MQVLSMEAGGDTVALIEELKSEYGASSDAELFRKVLAFAKVAAEQGRDSTGVVVLRGKASAQEVTIQLNG